MLLEEQSTEQLFEQLVALKDGLRLKNGPNYKHCGNILIELKRRTSYGEWENELNKIAKKIGYSVRTCQTCMRIALANPTEAELTGTISKIQQFVTLGKKKQYKEDLKQKTKNLTSNRTSSVICGDSLEWLKQQADNSIPFIISDPPFGIGVVYDGFTEPNNLEEHKAFITPFFQEMKRVLHPNGLIVLKQSERYWPFLHQIFPNCVVDVLPHQSRAIRVCSPLVRWGKSDRSFHRFTNSNSAWCNAVEGYHDNFSYNELHPCPMNEREAESIIKFYTTEESLVCDPFAGTFTIPKACQKLNRKFIGIEQNPEYVKLGKHRLGINN